VRPQAAVAAVQALACFLAVHVVNPVGVRGEESKRVEVLPYEVARVKVQPERRAVIHRSQGLRRGPEVVGDLARVHLVREPDALRVEHVQDRVPAVGKVGVARRDHGVGHRREHGDRMPDGRAGEPDHGRHAESSRGAGGVSHLGSRPAPHPLGLAVCPDPGRQDCAVPFVDRMITDRLADEVVGDRPAAQAVLGEQRVLASQVAGLREGAVHLEVVTPAGKLKAVITPAAGQLADLGEREVGPLAGEEGEGSRHGGSLAKSVTG
jgi:hypothetical protein